MASAAPAEDEHEEILDAGVIADGGRPRRRRVVAGADASVGTSAPAASAVAAAPTPEPTTSDRGRKTTATPMGNEAPYGGSAASGAPALKKTPLPNDDPWQRPAATARP